MPSQPPLIQLQGVTSRIAERVLFEELSLALARGERSCLVGRNGSGKSTLLGLLAGEIDPDRGSIFRAPGCRVAYLPQTPKWMPGETVSDFVACGLPTAQTAARHKVEAALDEVKLAEGQLMETLSGGEERRAALARALIGVPEVLLLDEPTNHLDLPTIEWLEARLADFPGALLMISHDRTFLTGLAKSVLWLDRGRILRLKKGFEHFEAWAEETLVAEAEARHKLNRQIAREEHWLARGVTARRKRNEGRLDRLRQLRQMRRDWLAAPATATLRLENSEASGDLVIAAERISKTLPRAKDSPVQICSNFSIKIRRGDRIGIIGPNGAGKTTLLRLLLGEIAPDKGQVRHGSKLETIYFDQRREALDPDASAWQVLCPHGGDSVIVGGRSRHVVGYLRDFLFEETQARQPVKALSGGERSRLLLARLFLRPGNLLVLDEPTNDLDLETLDLLTERLDAFDGTLLLVSHDRDFLDRLVNGVIAVEGAGEISSYVGGYQDYLRQRSDKKSSGPTGAAKKRGAAERPVPASRIMAKGLSPAQRRELRKLAEDLEKIGTAVALLEARLAVADGFARDPEGFAIAGRQLTKLKEAQARAEDRWLDLEAQRETAEMAARGGRNS